MSGYQDDLGQPLPVDQVARWSRSVHAHALLEKGDLSAPTCNDCHGNHGAAPPGVDSVAFVCGQCHGREAELFRKSAKQDGFSTHNQYLADGSTCDTCHEGKAPEVLKIRQFTECVTCHENHAVMRPTIALLGSLPETPCQLCHEPETSILEPPEVRKHYTQLKASLLKQASDLGLDGNARFDWLVDQAQQLPTHTIPAPGEGGVQLRPEFERLFQKFRIGKTHFTYRDPVSGNEVKVRVRQCTDCHTEDDSRGLQTAHQMTASMSQLIGTSARAERILLAAQRGGVEVRKAREALDGAVDSQIELEVLVHTFDSGGEFAAKFKEGNQQSTAAMEAGRASLGELSFRRKGLFIALGIILLVLVAMALKIHDMTRDEQ